MLKQPATATERKGEMFRRSRYLAVIPGLALAAALVGGVLTFVGLSPAEAQIIPILTLGPPTGITATSVELHGSVDAYGETTSVNFLFGYATSDSCPTVIALPWATKTLTFSDSETVTATITSLTPGSVVCYGLAATNADGLFTLGPASVQLAAAAPSVTTTAATDVTLGTVTLNGTVYPNGSETMCHFQWGTPFMMEAGGSSTPTAQASGTSLWNITDKLSGLTPSTTYDFYLVCNNSIGQNVGTTLSFTTSPPSVPSATTTAATNVAYRSVTLNGTVDPNGLTTGYYFAYGQSATRLDYDTPTGRAGSGTSAVTESANVSFPCGRDCDDLKPGTTYYFAIEAANADGKVKGSVLSFTTLAALPAPTVSTQAATKVGTTTATLNGTVDPDGYATSYYFYYNTTAEMSQYDELGTSSISAGSGTSAVAATAALTGLTPGTAYGFEVCREERQYPRGAEVR